jgi:enoyl-CoA hydratase
MFERERLDEAVELVRFSRPPANPLDAEILEALVELLDELEPSDARAIVLTGSGVAFSAGADLIRVLAEPADYIDRGNAALSGAFSRLFLFPKPVVAAVNGHAIAGGLVIALACDRRVCADTGSIRLGLAELRAGVPFPTAALEVVRAGVGPPWLHEVVTMGRTYPPDRALEMGLVDEVVGPGDVLPRAVEVARRLADVPPGTFALTKRMLRQPAFDRAEPYRAAFDDEGKALWKDEDVRAHVRRFLERVLGTGGAAQT